ncbi:MGMT family protein [Pseudoalteromonas mariniglutinosa]|uniref:MGMT family protein n=1 Tax=Pseudoalteromonas mariniglutinosa TaxID=206042 RepID=UPI003850ACC5
MSQVTKEELIFTIIAAIPHGKVASYGQIASLAGYPNHARLVGKLLKHMPSDSTIPWHRVVNSQGKLSFPQASEKYNLQRQQLLSEGVSFTKERINMSHYGWQ